MEKGQNVCLVYLLLTDATSIWLAYFILRRGGQVQIFAETREIKKAFGKTD
jgi:hypothetical protein